VLKIAREVEQAGKTAMTACSTCADFIVTKGASIEAGDQKAESRSAIRAVQPRIQAATRQASEALQRAKLNKDKIAKKFLASKLAERRTALFNKYDADGDGYLSRKEIVNYAKGEFSFDVPEENLDRICRQLIRPECPGIHMSLFRLLKCAVGIARDEEKGKDKRQKREEQEKREKEEQEARRTLVTSRQGEFVEQVETMGVTLTELEDRIQKAEEEVQKLANEASEITVEDLKTKASTIDDAVQGASAELSEVKETIQTVSSDVALLPDLQEQLKPKLSALSSRVESFGTRLRKVGNLATQGQQLALQKEFTDNESLRIEVAGKLRSCIEANGGKMDDLFDVISDNDGDTVTAAQVHAYLQQQQCEIELEKVQQIFALIRRSSPEKTGGEAEAGEAKAETAAGKAEAAVLCKEDFLKLIRIFFKVVKDIVLSDNLLIEESGQIRRMDVGEVLEVFEGPKLDSSVGVYRVRGRTLQDGAIGWVTVAGNQGITFLFPGGNAFKVLRPVVLTDDPKDLHGETSALRVAVEGEILEVLEWQRTSRSALGVTRIKGRSLGDGTEGWATVSDSHGVVYLEAL